MSFLPGPDRKPSTAERALIAELDPFYEAAVETACDLDRAYALRHPAALSCARAALVHEFCPPGEACFSPEYWSTSKCCSCRPASGRRVAAERRPRPPRWRAPITDRES